MGYDWDFHVLWIYRGAFLDGAVTTMAITICACLFGTVLAVPLALAMNARNRFIRWSIGLTVEVIRGVPVLVALLGAYYVLPVLLAIRVSAFWTAIGVLTVNLGAFAADILRGSRGAIPQAHVEAAKALGYSNRQVVARVIIPESFRRSVAGMTAMYISVLKLSTLASVLSVGEMLHTAQLVNQATYKPFEVYAAVGFVFVVVVLPGAALLRRLERSPRFALFPVRP